MTCSTRRANWALENPVAIYRVGHFGGGLIFYFPPSDFLRSG